MDEGVLDASEATPPADRSGRDDLMGGLRAVRGWLVAGAGVVLLLGCYLGVSKESDVSRQLPYLVSGGFGGLALVMLGSALIVADRLSAERDTQRRAERQVDDLHRLLVAAFPDTPQAAAGTPHRAPGAAHTGAKDGAATGIPTGETAAAGGSNDIGSRSADGEQGSTPWLAVPTGRTFHRPGCRLVAGKAVQLVGPAEVSARGLTPCRMCDPMGAPVPASP